MSVLGFVLHPRLVWFVNMDSRRHRHIIDWWPVSVMQPKVTLLPTYPQPHTPLYEMEKSVHAISWELICFFKHCRLLEACCRRVMQTTGRPHKRAMLGMMAVRHDKLFLATEWLRYEKLRKRISPNENKKIFFNVAELLLRRRFQPLDSYGVR